MSRHVWLIYLITVATYITLSLLAPTDQAVIEHYNISSAQLVVLRLTIMLPLIAIWFAAFYGYDRFRAYAQSIREAPDGRALWRVANGLGILALSLPATSIVSSAFDFITEDSPEALPATTVISNYLDIALALAAFWLLYRGSRMLLHAVDPRADAARPFQNATLVGTGIIAVSYTYFILQNPARRVAEGPFETATYYLNDWLLLLTIVIPYVFVWYLGLRSVAVIAEYTRTVKGILYKQIFGYLTKGLVAIVVFSIALQFLGNFMGWITSQSLVVLLAILYLLLIAIAIGYGYVAAGAKKLQKIEEV